MSAEEFEKVAEQVFSWLRMLDRSSYYDLLDVDDAATDTEIQAAFHRFSESFHPDRHRNQPEEIRAGVTRIFRRGAEAYGVLRAPRTRATYDLGLAQGILRMTTSTKTSAAKPEGLDSVCSSAAGKLHARQIERALSEKDFRAAEHLLRKALLAEGSNHNLEQRFTQLLALARKI